MSLLCATKGGGLIRTLKVGRTKKVENIPINRQLEPKNEKVTYITNKGVIFIGLKSNFKQKRLNFKFAHHIF